MLINQFNLFLHEAGKLPASFWVHKYYLAQKSFLLQLGEISGQVKKGTESAKDLEFFIKAIKRDRVNELELAEGFAKLGKIFSVAKVESAELELFENLTQKFLRRVQTHNNYSQKRQAVKNNLALEKQAEVDANLFKNEGISYCLEYYLAMFKQLEDLGTAVEKKNFIEAQQINLGFGDLPGLKEDFRKEESLTKFILLVLNDEARAKLLMDYYRCKIAIDDEEDPSKIERVLKQFIYFLLLSFHEQGVDQLTSAFFKPYGDKPRIEDLLVIFSDHD